MSNKTMGFPFLWWIVVAVILVAVLGLIVFGILRLTKRNDE